jgi:hypothetical protein
LFFFYLKKNLDYRLQSIKISILFLFCFFFQASQCIKDHYTFSIEAGNINFFFFYQAVLHSAAKMGRTPRAPRVSRIPRVPRIPRTPRMPRIPRIAREPRDPVEQTDSIHSMCCPYCSRAQICCFFIVLFLVLFLLLVIMIKIYV